MDFNEFHRRLVKGSDYPFIVRLIFLTASSWLFQGILYMDTSEKTFKIILDFIIFLLLLLIIIYFFNIISAIILAIVFSHTLNWIFNGQIFVLLKNLNLIKTSEESFMDYLDRIKITIQKNNSIIAAAAYGSFSRKKLKKSSDLDIRIIRKPGFTNGIISCFFILRERTKSFFRGFPLDIYLLDNVETLHKHIESEKAVIIYDPKKIF